jgi:hypothetical protein
MFTEPCDTSAKSVCPGPIMLFAAASRSISPPGPGAKTAGGAGGVAAPGPHPAQLGGVAASPKKYPGSGATSAVGEEFKFCRKPVVGTTADPVCMGSPVAYCCAASWDEAPPAPTPLMVALCFVSCENEEMYYTFTCMRLYF